ncbi:hypothetical protein JOL62DRAFT_579066 [Phyllosticta paracitricarpa]|uniref:Uncharacterized protein n=1 Tax=Phyllosticta paracitricarpa TaxID=2016321 RepID=A0ABR1N226_9PEZI
MTLRDKARQGNNGPLLRLHACMHARHYIHFALMEQLAAAWQTLPPIAQCRRGEASVPFLFNIAAHRRIMAWAPVRVNQFARGTPCVQYSARCEGDMGAKAFLSPHDLSTFRIDDAGLPPKRKLDHVSCVLSFSFVVEIELGDDAAAAGTGVVALRCVALRCDGRRVIETRCVCVDWCLCHCVDFVFLFGCCFLPAYSLHRA